MMNYYYGVVKFLEFYIKYFLLKTDICDEVAVVIAILNALEEGSEVFVAEENDKRDVISLLQDYHTFKSRYGKKKWNTILEYVLLILDIKHGVNTDFDEETASMYESVWDEALDNAVKVLNSKGVEVCTVSLPNGFVVIHQVTQLGRADWNSALIALEPTFEVFIEMLGDAVSKEFIKKFWNTKGGCFRKGFWGKQSTDLREQVWRTFFVTAIYSPSE